MGSNGGKKPKNRPVLSKKSPVLSMILRRFRKKSKKEKSSKPACLLDFLSKPHEKDIFAFLLVGFEPSQIAKVNRNVRNCNKLYIN